MKRVILVGCGKSKAAAPAPARELYTGNLFRAARAYAEAEVTAGRAARWAILSARHGLVLPHVELAPYDQRMSAGGVAAARWAEAVLDQLAAAFPGDELELVVLAGSDYVRPLRADLRGWCLIDQLHGLELGQRLAWFKEHTLQHPERFAQAQAEVDAWLTPRLDAAAKRRAEGQAQARARKASTKSTTTPEVTP